MGGGWWLLPPLRVKLRRNYGNLTHHSLPTTHYLPHTAFERPSLPYVELRSAFLQIQVCVLRNYSLYGKNLVCVSENSTLHRKNKVVVNRRELRRTRFYLSQFSFWNMSELCFLITTELTNASKENKCFCTCSMHLFCQKKRTHANKQSGEDEEITNKSRTKTNLRFSGFIHSRKLMERTLAPAQGLRIVRKKKVFRAL